jgi:integrase
LVEKDYTKTRITDGINVLKKGKKIRSVLEKDDLKRLQKFLEKENKHYLLACYMLYYTMIRPKELSWLRLTDFSLENKTIEVSGTFAKNRKTQSVTLPDFLAKFMIKLGVFKCSGDYYLFSKGFKPGKERHSEKQFRDYWNQIKKKLNFPDSYKFYSLKDTGITDLLEKTGNPLLVRDQARHSNISITDIYTPKNSRKARPEIADLDELW